MNKSRLYIYVSITFTLTTTIGQVLAIQQGWIMMSIFVSNAIVWLFVLYKYLNNKRNKIKPHQAKSFVSKVPQPDIEYKKIETHAEHSCYLANYGYEASSTRSGLWNKNKNGLFVRKRGGEFEGLIGIWPITEAFFMRLIEENRVDINITSKDILSDKDELHCNYWYISEMWIHISDDVLHEFIGYALKELLERCKNNTDEISIIIISSSPNEIKILKELHFTQKNKIGDQVVLCYSKSSPAHLRQMVSCLLENK